MNLNWAMSKRQNPAETALGDNIEYVVHECRYEGNSDRDAQQAINACVDKACALLEQNIREDSRYLLFEWDVENSTLTIVVTDDSKQSDSRDIVKCHFSAIDQRLNPADADPHSEWQSDLSEFADDIQFWIRDYLTTCTQFLNYSLIAAFHRESRANCTLL